jgi:hypothetical protein
MRHGIEGVEEAVAAAEIDLLLAIDLAHGRAELHWPCLMFGPIFASSSARNSPVFLSSTMKEGDCGEGILTCVQSWPLEVQVKSGRRG